MFWILLGIGVIGAILSGLWAWDNHKKTIPITLTAICVLIAASSFFNAQGQMYWKQLVASSNTHHWLVVDNSGGETLRHWIIYGYVKSSDKSDGWLFPEKSGNLAYVSGDAFVLMIEEPLEAFMETYKQRYNIPEDNRVLH